MIICFDIQVIISCGFYLYFKYLKISINLWVNLWYLNILKHGLRFQTIWKFIDLRNDCDFYNFKYIKYFKVDVLKIDLW